MSTTTNYSTLTNDMIEVFNQVKDKTLSINRANTLVKTSNAIINIQRTKILSTKVTEENKMEFFKD